MLTVGEILKDERLKKNITLAQVESQIRIREKFIDSVERNDWSNFSSKIYIVGLIRTYSKFLGLDPKKMIAFFRRDYERIEEVKFKRKVASHYLTPQTKKVFLISVGLIVVLFTSYFIYQLKVFLSPPQVEIITPTKTVFSREEKIQVQGKTDKDAAISIFGDRIFQNKDGIFTYDFPLHVGKNELSVEVVGANGKKTILKKEFMRKE